MPPTGTPRRAPANVALGLGRLGDEVALLTDVGDDFHGGFVLAHLRASNVTVHATPRGATSTARAVLSADGSAEYDFHLRWAPDPTPITGGAWGAVHIGSIAAFLQPGAARIDSLLDDRGDETALITFDPNIRPSIIGDRGAALPRFEELAARVDVVKLSDVDAEWLYPGRTHEERIARILELGAGARRPHSRRGRGDPRDRLGDGARPRAAGRRRRHDRGRGHVHGLPPPRSLQGDGRAG